VHLWTVVAFESDQAIQLQVGTKFYQQRRAGGRGGATSLSAFPPQANASWVPPVDVHEATNRPEFCFHLQRALYSRRLVAHVTLQFTKTVEYGFDRFVENSSRHPNT